uniref:NADH-ubiquinone oxidoreductase chain 4 n=1 Tax=Trachinocephalus myops TaxID=172131 RepID=A0A1B0V0Q1_TRAMY|nr:NADH dehydrogenase subunit 4 [Trachinocephalus myops]
MLKVLFSTIMLVPVVWLAPSPSLWASALSSSFLVALFSISWLVFPHTSSFTNLSPYMGTDPLSTPLLVLTCWLLPLMILASQGHISHDPPSRQRLYISLLISLQIFLIMAFGATELIMFYIMFEATLVPTLFIITRWGNQKERLAAGTYFLFYTLAGSLPLLVALLLLSDDLGTLSMLILSCSNTLSLSTLGANLWWLACVMAFLVKMPLYGVHLWLPKAHVEAPVAGSMVLAAVLLKLGGYGMIRILPTLQPLSEKLAYPFIALALWGIVMTGTICLRQTDLKSLIAYSSVSHMGLVAGAILIQTPWGLTGALLLMIAHGLASSALFCLANTNYERLHTRTMLLARALQVALPLVGTWWFLGTLANLALPPLPNLMGELFIVSSLFHWSNPTLLITGSGMLITAAYSLYLFLVTQRGRVPSHLSGLYPTYTREHLLISLHLLPLLLLILKPEIIWGPHW